MRTERSAIARHALTVLAGQPAVVVFGVTDTAVAGHRSPGSLAALSTGSAIFVSVCVVPMGNGQALPTLRAAARQRQHGGTGHAGPPGSVPVRGAPALDMVVLLLPGPLLEFMGAVGSAWATLASAGHQTAANVGAVACMAPL